LRAGSQRGHLPYGLQAAYRDLAGVQLLTCGSAPCTPQKPGALEELYPSGQLATRRFRPNIVISTPDGAASFVENGWVGRTLRVGEQVQLAISESCPRCVMITLPQGGLPKGP
jgi:hypothetical protein